MSRCDDDAVRLQHNRGFFRFHCKQMRLKTDVWALGAILFEIIHGHCPFGKVNQTAIVAAIIAPTTIHFPAVENPILDVVSLHLTITSSQHTSSRIHTQIIINTKTPNNVDVMQEDKHSECLFVILLLVSKTKPCERSQSTSVS